MNNVFSNLTYTDIKNSKPKFAIIPIGAFEQHGDHLPMTTDTLIACAISSKISAKYGGFCISPITVSCSQEHKGFFGTAWISASTLNSILEDILRSLEYSGVSKFVIVNGHGGNYVVNGFAQETNVKKESVLLLPAKQHHQEASNIAGISCSLHDDMHGGEYETSIMLSAYPQYVKKEYISDHSNSERPLLTLLGMKEYTNVGIIGYPSLATKEKGDLFLEALSNCVSEDIERFLSL